MLRRTLMIAAFAAASACSGSNPAAVSVRPLPANLKGVLMAAPRATFHFSSAPILHDAIAIHPRYPIPNPARYPGRIVNGTEFHMVPVKK